MGKHRISPIIEIICGPGKTNQICRDGVNEPTQETMSDIGMTEEIYYGVITQYLDRYIWQIVGNLP